MTRTDTIRNMMSKANRMLKEGWSSDVVSELWETASEWNSNHDEEEYIFMSDYQSDDSEVVNGFMIEDDFWVFEE